MYLIIISCKDKKYYLLCVKDSKNDIWVERFISEPFALALMSLKIKIKNR